MSYFSAGDIPVVDSHEQMRKIGRELVEQRPDIYTPRVLSDLIEDYRTFDSNEDAFYETVYNYWTFGCNISEWFRYGFANKSSEEKDGYFTIKNKDLYVSHLNAVSERDKLEDKFEAYKLLAPYYHREVTSICSENDFELFSDFVKRHRTIMVKPECGGFGAGVHRVHVNPGEEKRVFDRLLQEGAAFFDKNKWSKTSKVVIEEIIDQDGTMASLHEFSVNCVRLTTIRVDGKVNYFYPWLKVGMDGAGATGSYQGGSFDAAIDVDTGVLNTYGIKKGNIIFENHPNTGIPIKGFQIPKWDDLLDFAKMLSDKLPQFGYIGWDFALNKKGEWCIVEANYAGNQECQWLYGRGLKAELEALLGWKPDVRFWWQKK